ncbi:MAG: hypothetical protein K5894_04545 [Lachnospiraceae bacterium]|nr:hypothetical protein [Lachnospiraceae bacterium]
MKKNKYLMTVIFLMIIAFISLGLSKIVMNKDGYKNKYEFFHSKTDFDALFIGTSRMHEGVDPIYLWENYGISSYNLASAGESIQVTYYVLAEALEHCNPKVVFVEPTKISDEKNAINCGYGFVHESLDPLPLNKNKLEAISYASKFFDGGMLAFLSNIYAYHDRVDSLEEEDFNLPINYDKGAYLMTDVVKVNPVSGNFTDEVQELQGGDGVIYYKKILDLCKEKNIKCVLLDIPASADYVGPGFQKRLNALIEITEKKGGESLNLAETPDLLGIDFDHDFGDIVHLNFMGAAKVSEYLGKYMQTNYSIVDHRDDPEYAEAWEEDIEKWNEQRIRMLADKADPVSYIFGTDPEDTYCEVYMADLSKIESHYALQFCFDKMGIKPEEVKTEEIGNLDMKIVVRSKADDRWLAEQYFVCDQSSLTFRVHESE